MKSRVILSLAGIILLAGVRCSAGTLIVTVNGTWANDVPTNTESAPGAPWGVSFQIASNPTPINVTAGVQTVVPVTNLVFTLNGTAVQNQASGGSIELFDGEGFRLYLPDGDALQVQDTKQLFSGSDASPTVLAGSYPPGSGTNAFLYAGSTGFYYFTSNNIVITPGPAISSVVNAYSAQAGLTPGTVAVIAGANFGSVASNVTVTVGGKTAYLYPASVTSTQLQIEIPMELTAGSATVTVAVSGVSSDPFKITLVSYAPTCQPQDNSGSGLGKILTTGAGLVTLTTPAHPGDQLSITATGLGPTIPPTATGLAGAANPTATLPGITIGGITATVASAVAVAGSAGVYQVNFTVPVGVQGTEALVMSVGATGSSTSCTIALGGLSSVVNNASFANPGVVSPGSIATVFANGLGTTTDALSGLFPSSKSEGVQVNFKGEAAPLFHIVASTAQQQVDLLIPTDLPASGTVNVQLNSYADYTLTMVPANPGFYRIPDPKVNTRFNVIAQFANTTWLALPVSTTTALGLPACTPSTGALVVCGQPATAGDYLVIYVTGLGLATPNGDPAGSALVTGQVAPADGSTLYKTPTLPTVTVGGVPATVLFSGLAPGFAGLYQLDIQVPPGIQNGDDVAVKVTMAGASDTATISVQARGN